MTPARTCTLETAKELALAAAPAPIGEERSLAMSGGRFLFEPLLAGRALPGCDNSAMDGFAVRSADLPGANRDRPVELRVVATLFAGHSAQAVELAAGEAARVFTGAPVPRGADAVVRQEAAALDGDKVRVFVEVNAGRDIRRAGEELATGEVAVRAGARIDGHVAGVVAALGQKSVRVARAPRVAVLSTGDELVRPGEPIAPWQSYESNLAMVVMMMRELNADVVLEATVPDDLACLRSLLLRASAEAELVVTTGGASVGDRDLVKRALAELDATSLVDGVALKPGKPVGLARLGRALVLVLPGNPGACAVGFDQLARPVVLAAQGVRERRLRVWATLTAAVTKQPGLTYLVAGSLEPWDGESADGMADGWKVRPLRGGPGQLIQNVAADGWIILPRGTPAVGAGARVEVELFTPSRYEALAR